MLSCVILILCGIFVQNSSAVVDTEKLCKGQPYGTLLRNPEDCGSFYVCGFIVRLQKCSTDLHFDQKRKVCNWPKYANCDWVEPPSEDKPTVEPDVPVTPSTHLPVDPTVDDNSTNKPSSAKTPGYPTVDDVITDEPSSTNPPGYPTVDDVITDEPSYPNSPGYPTVDDVITDEPSSTNPPGYPTVDDVITDKPSSANPPGYPTDDDVITDKPSSANPPGYSTVDDVITDEPSYPNSPGYPTVDDVITDEPSSANPPGYPTVDDVITDEPSHPNSSASPTTDDYITNKPTPPSPTVDDVITDNPTDSGDSSENPTADGNYTTHHWNLIASIVSVASSSLIGNEPTAGAHNPQTGYPVDVMTGYDPKNVQCLYYGFYFLPHPTSCQKYYICAYRHLHLHSCGKGVIWNHKQAQCELNSDTKCYARDVGSEETTERVTPFIDYGTDEPTKRPKPTRLTTQQQQPKQPICLSTRQAYLPNADDCQKYYICIMGKPVMTTCPSGMHWNAIGEFCGKPEEVRCVHRKK